MTAWSSTHSLISAGCAVVIAISAVAIASPRHSTSLTANRPASDGPADQGATEARQEGDPVLGREVFRSETFGNEGFWTDAVRLPAGIKAAKVTPMQALQLGLQIDSDALNADIRKMLADELRKDPSGRTSSLLNDPAVTLKLIKAGAVIGMVPRGERVGVSCALCHTMTDASSFKSSNGGSIGRRLDGLANHSLNIGAIFATAANSRALYPALELSLKANKGKALGRAPQGLTAESTEAEVDAYLNNPAYYPVGMFDDSFDGNGDPMHNSPLFRQDLAAPYGSEGMIAKLDNFSNLVYTTLFDQTILTTPGGRALLHKLGGAAGDEIADNYVKILSETGVHGYPYVHAMADPMPGTEEAPTGLRVDNTKLLAMNAYLAQLPAPRGAPIAADVGARGRQIFRTAGCTSCHNVDQSRPVPATIHPMKEIFPGDNPVVLAQREPPLNPVMNTVDSIFDDKMVVVNASLRGEKRGIAMPLLLDLARKPVFLHDNSVASLDDLFNARRGSKAPHPFYVTDRDVRATLVAYLKSLDTQSR